MEIDCYKLLDISPQADAKTIRKAWRMKTKEVHPDVNPSPDAAIKFRELSAAMETLLDDASRIKHDNRFGYSGIVKNKYSNTKQSFSDHQREKAKVTVNEWTQDYNVAMAMREEQRRKHLRMHRRNQLAIIIGVGMMLLTSIFLWIIFN
jgi:DnaJ-class molecular chaperone